jgi:ABC-type dipeptide/oligopeptide/nickel transport system permease subunit
MAISTSPARTLLRQALWNLRFPALYTLGPAFSLILVNLFFGLPRPLWFVACGFFLFSMALFAVLVRGEIRQLRQSAHKG